MKDIISAIAKMASASERLDALLLAHMKRESGDHTLTIERIDTEAAYDALTKMLTSEKPRVSNITPDHLDQLTDIAESISLHEDELDARLTRVSNELEDVAADIGSIKTELDKNCLGSIVSRAIEESLDDIIESLKDRLLSHITDKCNSYIDLEWYDPTDDLDSAMANANRAYDYLHESSWSSHLNGPLLGIITEIRDPEVDDKK